MSMLLNEDFTMINTSAWDNFFKAKPTEEAPRVEDSEQTETEEQSKAETSPEEKQEEETEQEATTEGYPAAGQLKKWGEWLDNTLKENAELSREAGHSETEIVDNFFEKFFEVNWKAGVGTKLKTFKILRRLFINDKGEVIIDAFDPDKNAYLVFLQSDFVQELIASGKLTEEKQQVLVHAFAKNNKKVAAAEFRRGVGDNEYNLIYCPAFYELDVSIMQKYLAIQAGILKPTQSSYTDAEKNFNKKVFLKTKEAAQTDDAGRAEEIKAKDGIYSDITDMSAAVEFNSSGLIDAIIGKNSEKPDNNKAEDGTRGNIDTTEIDSIIKSWEGSLKNVNIDQATINKLEQDTAVRNQLIDALLAKLKANN